MIASRLTALTKTHFAARATRKLIAIVIACLHGCSHDPAANPTRQQQTQQKSAETPLMPRDENPPAMPGNTAAANAAPTPAPWPVHFRTLGPESGFEFTRFDDQQGQWRILEANGGGAAVLDFDLDCWPDVFLTNGCRIPVDPNDLRTPGQLFRNRSQLRFQNVSRSSRLEQFGLGYGCAAADADEDGFDDLYITRCGGNQFWHNNGDGTFSEIAAENGTLSGDWGSSAAFADLNHDGWQDLYVVNYLIESDTRPRLCPETSSPTGFIGCSPALFQGAHDRIFLADGSGRFLDASAHSGLDQLPGKGLGVVICDLDGDRLPEIYVANDGEANFLFTVEVLPAITGHVPAIRLHNQALPANAALNELGYAQASMGIATADFDHNSQTDLFLTHFYGDTNTLYLNHSSPGQLAFLDATRASALGPPSRQKLGFGTVAADFDGDGWDDIFVANGHVDDRSWMPGGQPFRMLPQLFANHQGRFFEVSASSGNWFQQTWLGRGATTADFNQDGRLDLVVSCQLDPAAILINEPVPESPNTTPAPATASVIPIGTLSTRTPWGLSLLIHNNSTHTQLHPGESFQSSGSRELLLHAPPEAPSLNVTTSWPSGNTAKDTLAPARYYWVETRGLISRKD